MADIIKNVSHVPWSVLYAAVFYSSSRVSRDFSREIRAQSDTCLHREDSTAMRGFSPTEFNSRSRELARDSGQRKLTSSQPNPCASSRAYACVAMLLWSIVELSVYLRISQIPDMRFAK